MSQEPHKSDQPAKIQPRLTRTASLLTETPFYELDNNKKYKFRKVNHTNKYRKIKIRRRSE